MKKILLITFGLLLLAACKKTEFAPEGPTDIRIRNISDMNFSEIVIKTSEYDEDVATISAVNAGATSDYVRFRKAYPKAEITAKVNVGDTPVTFSTGEIDYTYMNYLSTMRVTFKVYISNLSTHKLETEMIAEEELVP
jgi:hypothetical protein